MALLRTAQDARSAPRERPPIPSSPSRFDGTIEEFFARVIESTLLPVEQVVAFHRALVEYLAGSEPLFLVRALTRTERRLDHRTDAGDTFRATDNSPSWWVYGALAAGHEVAPGCMDAVMRGIPCHMFDVPHVSAAVPSASGWHVAHILNAKDRDTAYRGWSREELVRRCVRNLHPANYFLLPKVDWQRMGNDPGIVGYVGGVFRERYGEVWEEFRRLAGGEIALGDPADAGVRVTLRGQPVPKMHSGVTHAADSGRPAVAYRASRLTFKRDLIEPLGESSLFRIETPVGHFEMTKAEFYRIFPGVVASRSYRDDGVYHYPRVPMCAEPLRVPGRLASNDLHGG